MRKLRPIIFILIISGLGLIYYALTTKPKNATERVFEEVKKQDEARLKEGADSRAEMAKSLKRMALQNPEKSKDFVRSYANDNSPELRAASAEVAGYFVGDEWDKIVVQGLKDSDRSVRIAALRGLLRQPAEGRSHMVDDFLKSEKRSSAEIVWAQMFLAKLAKENELRSRYEAMIFSELNQVKADELSELLLTLYRLWPDKKELYEFAKMGVSTESETPEFYPSFQYLASFAPELLIKRLNDTSWPNSRYFLMVVRDFLFEKCPAGWPDVLNKLKAHQKMDAEITTSLEQKNIASRCQNGSTKAQ